jgi:hypothetical protein
LPEHDTDPPTASIAPRITILHWPVVQDILPPTLTASRATTEILHPDPVKLADGIPNSIHSAHIVTDVDEAVIWPLIERVFDALSSIIEVAVIGPLICSVRLPVTSILPTVVAPCTLTFEPSSRIASPHDRHCTLLLPVSCTAPLPEQTLRSCTPAVPVTLPLTWPSRMSTCTTSPDKTLLESIDNLKALASLLLLLLLITTFALAVMLSTSSWTPDRSLGYGVYVVDAVLALPRLSSSRLETVPLRRNTDPADPPHEYELHAPPLALKPCDEEMLSACKAILPPDPAPDPYAESPPIAVTDPEPEMLPPISHTLPPDPPPPPKYWFT